MSEENKNLGEEAKDKLNDATETAKEKASELADDAKEAFESAKEKASEFAEDAKEATKEFAEDAKETFNEFTKDAEEALSNDKTIAIISHLTLIGWVIALIMNNNNKTEFGSFYVRQMLGLIILSFIGIIPFIGWILWIGVAVLWVMSLVGALGGKKTLTPIFGKNFQEWFKSL